MYSEEEFIQLSALGHIMVCERQCALIHIEMIWEDNFFTADGSLLHERVHSGKGELRGDVYIARTVDLQSFELGVVGKADVVEFHRSEQGVKIPGRSGLWIPYPIEYKRGTNKPHRADEVQLCAQAMCLEEMLGIEVPEGALFYGRPRRRKSVFFTPELRQLTCDAAERAHRLISSGTVPPPKPGPYCRSCSLVEVCMPELVGKRSAKRFLSRIFRES